MRTSNSPGALPAILALAVVVLASGPVSAASLNGQRLKVTGIWNGTEIAAHRFQMRDAQKNPATGQITGHIGDLDFDSRSLSIGPLTINWDEATEFEGLSSSELSSGHVVTAKVRTVGAGKLKARSIEAESEDIEDDEIQILGAITAGRATDVDQQEMTILGVPIVYKLTEIDRAKALSRRPDTRRPDEQFTTQLFGRPLIIGGEIGARTRYRKDHSLDGSEEDDVARIDSDLQLELLYTLNDKWSIFLEGKFDREDEVFREDDDEGSEDEIRRGLMWVYADSLFGSAWGAQIGRQNFNDEREWWWDDDLDAMRLHYFGNRASGFLAIAKEIARESNTQDGIDPEQDGVVRWLGHAAIRIAYSHALEVFALHQDDRSGQALLGDISAVEDETDADLDWFGFRLGGKPSLGDLGRLKYWADFAWVRGSETLYELDDLDSGDFLVESVVSNRVRGHALDAGFSWTTELPLQPTFTLHYARGSGDTDPDDGVSNAFRPTGLEDNNAKYNGVDRFRYYGELTRPDLTNVEIATLSLGFELLPDSSIEFVFHRYRQPQPSSLLEFGRIDAKLDGISDDIGYELDVVVGLEEWTHLEMEFVAGIFQAGRAYGQFAGERAFTFDLKIEYNF